LFFYDTDTNIQLCYVADMSIKQYTICPAMTSHHGATQETKRAPICTACVQKTGQDSEISSSGLMNSL